MLCLQKTDVFILLSGAEPRVVDKPYLVDNMVIPQGTIISCLPYSFHRTEGVFPEPDKFYLKDGLSIMSKTNGESNNKKSI